MDAINCLNGKLGYMPVAKVACTSVKKVLFEMENQHAFDRTEVKISVHQYWLNQYQSIDDCDFKFIVIRDPIKRFLSAYSNRVTFHNELSKAFIQKNQPKLLEQIPVFNPGIGQFIEFFDTYRKVGNINGHTKPMTELFTDDLSFFDKVYPLEQISDLTAKLNQYHQTPLTLPHEQTGGRKIPLKDLNSMQIDYLFDVYQEDYQLIKDFYSIDEVWRAWKSFKTK